MNSNRKSPVESTDALPHAEWDDAASPVFLGPDGKPLAPPEEDFYCEDDREFDAVLEFGLASLRRRAQGES